MGKYLVATLMVALFAVGSAQALQQPRQREAPNGQALEIPTRIEFEEPHSYWEPIPWVAASEVAGSAGFTINEEFLRYSVPGKWIDELKEAHEAGIRFVNNETADAPEIVHFSLNPGTPVIRPGGPVSSFQELIDSSRFIAVGTVRESVAGFAYGVAGQMLIVQVEEWQGQSEQTRPDEVLFFWPGGEVEVGYATIFATMDGVPMPPKVGEKIALFPEVGRERHGAFITFLGSRHGGLGAAARFGVDGQMQVARNMAQHVPSVARMNSSAVFSSQVQVAIARSAKR